MIRELRRHTVSRVIGGGHAMRMERESANKDIDCSGANAGGAPSDRPKSFHWWPIGVFLTLSLAANVLAIWCVRLSTSVNATLLGHTLTGLALGQWAWLTLIAGWTGRRLAGGLVVATLVGAIAWASFVWSMEYLIATEWSDSLVWGIFLIPLSLLAGALPFVICRRAVGWQVVGPGRSAQSMHAGTGDLFWMLAIVAATMAIAEVAQTVWQLPRAAFVRVAWMQGVLVSILVSALFALPTAVCALRFGKSRGATLGLVVVLPMLIVTAALAFATLSGVRSGAGISAFVIPELSRFGVAGLVAVAVLTLGCWALRGSGYRFCAAARGLASATPAGPGQGRTDILAEDATTAPQAGREPSERRNHRYWELAIIAAGLLAGLYNASTSLQREAFDRATFHLANELVAQGGNLHVRDYSVTQLKLPPGATDQDLIQCEYLPSLEELDLSGTYITAAGLRELVAAPRLQRLDLSDMHVDQTMIEELVRLPGLYHLSLAGTDISSDGLRRLMRELNIAELDISRTGLSPVELRSTLPINFGLLRMRGLGLTDADLAEWENFPLLARALDLRDNSIRGPGLSSLMYCQALWLDGNPLTDQDFGPVARQLNTMHLGLSNTPLSDAVLANVSANRAISWLDVGNGGITEQGIAAAFSPNWQVLGFHGAQFKGACFEHPQSVPFYLDLSKSAADDRSIGSLRNLNSLYRLSLRGCDITDAALESLSLLRSLQELDLGDTRITADGLVHSGLADSTTIYLDWDQFDYDDLRRIRDRFTLRLGQELSFY
ncbi:MAG: hypothetical protein D6753_07500 [Planctomycetota bacterium]|nr:MAG: hypothetical protein D6753_07500 [Planctomycetota bacterium]